MIRLWRRFSDFIGPGRLTALFVIWAVTGLLSLVLNAVDADWVIGVQTLLLLGFVGASAGIIFSALDPFDRGRWIGILAPSFALVVLGTTFFREQTALFMGLAFGWIVAAQFIFNPRGPMSYQKAVRAMRKSDYETATKELDQLVRQEPKNPAHYQFRAEIHRLAGKLAAAKRDYKKMIDLGGDHAAVGYNLLAEVHLQAGEYNEALTAGNKALELAPGEWVTAYNLGMIEDRLRMPREALEHLDNAIEIGVPDSRHRLLIHLYRARAWARLQDDLQARAAVDALKLERRALKEWRKLLDSPQAETLRAVLADDVEAAEALINGQIDATALGDLP
jgi:tetratricopeptide (TPR) repeat protein